MIVEAKPLPRAKRCSVTRDGRVFREGRELPTFINKNGRRALSIRADDGCQDMVQVARLVGAAFCPDFRPYLLAAYKDGDKTNCHADNLTWVPPSHYATGCPGGKRRTAKLTDAMVADIRAAKGLCREIAERFGISASHVAHLRNGWAWGHSFQSKSPAAENADFPPPSPHFGAIPPEMPPGTGKGHPSAEKRPSGGLAAPENAPASPDAAPRAYCHPECAAPSYVSKAKADPPP